jgi:hypothetical protein
MRINIQDNTIFHLSVYLAEDDKEADIIRILKNVSFRT